MAARLTRVFCACACWDAAHQSETPLVSSRPQNSPSTSRRPPLLAGVLRRESSGGAASPHFDVVNERQRPPRDGSVLLLWRSCQRSSHGRGPCSDFGPPLSALWLPEANSQSWMGSQSPSPLGCGPDDGEVDLTERRRTPLQRSFPSGMFPRPLPPSSVAGILYLRELRQLVRRCLLVYTISDLIRIRRTSSVFHLRGDARF